MANAPVVAIGLTYRDRDSNRAKITFYCAWTGTAAAVWILATALADRVSDLSNGLLCKIDLTWRYTVDSPASADASADLGRKILLLITNADDEINGIVIPSPADNWEIAGSYAGIRLDLASAGATQFAAMLLVVDLRTEDDHAVGTILAAGGLAL